MKKYFILFVTLTLAAALSPCYASRLYDPRLPRTELEPEKQTLLTELTALDDGAAAVSAESIDSIQDTLLLYKYRVSIGEFYGITNTLYSRLIDLTQLPSPSVEDYISFTQRKLNNENIEVAVYDKFSANPEKYLLGTSPSIFFLRSGVGGSHYSTVIVTPHRHVQLIDSFSPGEPSYPFDDGNKLFTLINRFNLKKEMNIAFVTFKGTRQYSPADCPFFAIHAALHFDSNDRVIDLGRDVALQEATKPKPRAYQLKSSPPAPTPAPPSTTILNFIHSARHLVPTQSISRLNFLRALVQTLPDETKLERFFNEAATEIHNFVSIYEEKVSGSNGYLSPIYERLSISVEGEATTPYELAEPYFVNTADRKRINGYMLYIKADFFIWRINQYLATLSQAAG